jgi:hypothetical protein
MGPLSRNSGLGKNRFHWTFWNTSVAIDAGLRINDEHVIIQMESFHGAYQSTISITTVDARFGNGVSHFRFCLLGRKRDFMKERPICSFLKVYIKHEP